MEDKTLAYRKRNLEIIDSIKRHLEHPKKFSNLYYIPDFERAVIYSALKKFRKLYFDPSVDVDALNNSIYCMLCNLKKPESDSPQNSDD